MAAYDSINAEMGSAVGDRSRLVSTDHSEGQHARQRQCCSNGGQRAGMAALVISMFALACGLLSLSLSYSDPSGQPFLKSLKKKVAREPTICENVNYRDTTLKTVFEMPIQAFLAEVELDDVKHELSEVIAVHGHFYTVADSSWNVYKLEYSLPRFSKSNAIISPTDACSAHINRDEDSSYEGIVYEHNEGLMYLVREAIEVKQDKKHGSKDGDTVFKALVQEIQIHEDENGKQVYDILRVCPLDKEFDGDSKGIEGVALLYDISHTPYMLFLCEGNHCAGGEEGREKGNGRIVLAKKVANLDEEDNCEWQVTRIMHLPSTAHFTDYSAMEINQVTGYVIVTSQEDSQAWLGKITTFQPSRTFDPLAAEFVGDGIILDFPRNDDCLVTYCNIEGISWIPSAPHLVVAVSDKMKGGGRQSYLCQQHDQSIHVFALPSKWEKNLEKSFL